MERRHALSVMGLLLAAAVAFGAAWPEERQMQGSAEDRLSRPPAEPALSAEDARRVLRTYFINHYSEANCSAIYADLTHDGVEELLVLSMEDSRTGEQAALHEGALDADGFTGARAAVLRAGESGEVLPIYEFTCGAEHSQWGELYLTKSEGADCLLWYAPYTGAGRSDFQLALFYLGEDGAVLDQVRERRFFPASGGAPREGDADQAEIDAFLALAEALLKDAEPVIVYDIIHDPVTGADGPRRFDYLDALFTSF